jgi:hypothetical protein
MMICKLCNIKEANQTGSHITSAFLLSSQLGKRGEEKGFVITTNPDQDYSINHGDKGVKEDYILCRDCERRLGVVEEIYATEITHKIEENKFEQNFKRTDFKSGYYKLESFKVHSIAFQLLMQSNIWRASISQEQLFAHFKLSDNLEERMRFNIDLFLPVVINFKIAQSLKEWTKMIDDCNALFDYIPIAIVKAENIENKEMTFEFFDNISKSPYHIILNENLILVYNDRLEWNDDFFDLKDELPFPEIINYKYQNPLITVISNQRYFKTIHKIKDLTVKKRNNETKIQAIKEMRMKNVSITPEKLSKAISGKVNRFKMKK